MWSGRGECSYRCVFVIHNKTVKKTGEIIDPSMGAFTSEKHVSRGTTRNCQWHGTRNPATNKRNYQVRRRKGKYQRHFHNSSPPKSDWFGDPKSTGKSKRKKTSGTRSWEFPRSGVRCPQRRLYDAFHAA